MTPLALIFMCTAVTSVTVLVTWCFYRVLWHERHPQKTGKHRNDGR